MKTVLGSIQGEETFCSSEFKRAKKNGATNQIVCLEEDITGTEVTNPKMIMGSSLDKNPEFRVNNVNRFFYDKQRHVSNDQAYGRLLGNTD
jgi:hypothetical protein